MLTVPNPSQANELTSCRNRREKKTEQNWKPVFRFVAECHRHILFSKIGPLVLFGLQASEGLGIFIVFAATC